MGPHIYPSLEETAFSLLNDIGDDLSMKMYWLLIKFTKATSEMTLIFGT